MRDIPPALIQPANNQQVTETSSTSPVRSSPGCSPAGFSSSAKSTEPMGTHPLVSPNSSLLPLAIFAALILEKENSGTWWDRRGCGILVGLMFFEEGFMVGWWSTEQVDQRGGGWPALKTFKVEVGQGSEQPALAEGDKRTLKGPSQPKLLCESILWLTTTWEFCLRGQQDLAIHHFLLYILLG